MRIVSNKEFEVLTSKCAPRLKAMAKSRSKTDPTGYLEASDLDAYMEACSYSGDHKSVQWLKNLKHMAKSGLLRQLRQGSDNWNNHALYVNALHKKGEIKFKLGDAVMCKESGKQGQVIDYLPDEKEFLVVLDPFQIKTYKAGDLEKVAKVAQFDTGALYRVRIGGSPPDSADEYGTRALAEEAALEMAREIAERDQDGSGMDPDTVAIYGGPHDPVGWGACPADDDGAYYPVITVEST